MHDDVGAECEWLLQCRRQEGVVDHAARTRRVRRMRDMAHVRDAQQRVRRRFDPDEVGTARKPFGEGCRIGEIGELDAETALLRPCIEQAPGATVAIVRGEHEASRRHQFEHECDRGHAARGDDGAHTLLELGERAAELVACRIAAARIVVRAFAAEAGERVVRAEVQRRHHRTVLQVGFDPGAHGAGTGRWTHLGLRVVDG